MINNEIKYKSTVLQEEILDTLEDIQENQISTTVEFEENVDNISINENNLKENLNMDNDNNNIKEETEETNCLALTVRKDYGLLILKNGLIKTFHITFKIAFCTLLLNILTLLL